MYVTATSRKVNSIPVLRSRIRPIMVGAGVPVPVPGHTVRPTKKLDSGSLVQTGRQWRQEKGQQNNLGHTRKTPVIDFFLQKGERRR